MRGRPRTATDDAVFSAVIDVIGRVGPTGLTLGLVGDAVGLTAGALVQRHGSKSEMLRGASAWATGKVPRLFSDATSAHEPGSGEGVLDALVALAGSIGGREAMARHLAWLVIEISDDQLRGGATAHQAAVLAELERCLRRVALSEPSARALEIWIVYQGALLTWAVSDTDEPMESWLRSRLRGTLAAAFESHR